MKKVRNYISKYSHHEFIFEGIKSRSKNNLFSNFSLITRFNYFVKSIASFFVLIPKKHEFYPINECDAVIIGIYKIEHLKSLTGVSKIVIIGGPLEYKYCIENQINFISGYKIYRTLGLLPFTVFRNKRLIKVLKKVHDENFLGNSDKIKNIITNNDFLPFYRAVIASLSELHVKLITIQHGLYTYKKINGEVEGQYSDTNIVFDNFQKEKLQKNLDFNGSTFIVLNNSNHNNNHSKHKKYQKIILVGEGWHMQSFKRAYSFFKEIYNLRYKLKTLTKFKVFYRPHPRERLIFKLLKPLFKLDLTNISDLIHNDAIYIGYTSSLLKDVKDKGGFSIQVLSRFSQNTINMQAAGYCSYSVNESDLITLLNKNYFFEN